MLSGDSTVNAFSFNGRQVSFLYEDFDSDECYRVVIDTPMIYSEIAGGKNCVHMRLEGSDGKLSVDPKSKLFVLPGEFSKQMAVIKRGFHILAGLNSERYKMIFILQGNGKILVCPVEGEESVSIQREGA